MRLFFSKVKNKVVPGLAAASVAIASATPALAVEIKDDLDPEKVIGDLLDILLTMGQLIGGGLMIYAAITFGLSLSQENPDQQARAIKFVVAGAVLVGIKWLLKGIGVIA